MAALDTFSYHVAGPIIPQLNIGTANAYVNVGVCEDGADFDFQVAASDVKHDGGGGPSGFETDNIFLNMICVVRFVLVPFAGTRMSKLRAMAHASATEGVMVQPGTLYGENSFYPSLYLPVSAVGEIDGPWRFPTVRVVRPGSMKVSTRESKPQFEFRAINYFPIVSQNTILTNTLWVRTAPP
jgi:hypothetical protein